MFSAATKSQTEVTLGDLKLEMFKYHRAVKLNQVPACSPSARCPPRSPSAFSTTTTPKPVLFGSLARCVVLFCVGAIKTKLTRIERARKYAVWSNGSCMCAACPCPCPCNACRLIHLQCAMPSGCCMKSWRLGSTPTSSAELARACVSSSHLIYCRRGA